MKLLLLLAISDLTVGLVVIPMRLTTVFTTRELLGVWPLASTWTCE
jgi:hypothetical protein